MAATQKLVKTIAGTIAISLGLTIFLSPSHETTLNTTQTTLHETALSNTTNPYGLPQSTEVNSKIENLTTETPLAESTNVIFILADDLDWETFRNIPELEKLQENNIVFTNHVVTDSLCCPSRASILTGKYVKNHKVYSNVKETNGGWESYKKHKHHKNDIASYIKNQNRNIETVFIGKYLNQYTENKKQPGWDSFITPITPKPAYEGYNYVLSVNGKKRKYGSLNKDYLNTVLTNHAVDAIEANKDRQFFMVYSSFLPHSPYEARVSSKGIYGNKTTLTKNPDFNTTPINAPTWLDRHAKLGKKQIRKLTTIKQKRIEATHTLGVDIHKIINKLEEENLQEKTVLIITSDNGYHLGNRKLPAGKRTPYYHDTVVPLVIIDPSNIKTTTIHSMTSSVDLHPTIVEYLNIETSPETDGSSLRKIIKNPNDPTWRNWVLTEANSKSSKNDPDYTKYAPETFKAIRSKNWLYIVYTSGEKELYNVSKDPYEMHNIIGVADSRLKKALHTKWQQAVMCKKNECIIQ